MGFKTMKMNVPVVKTSAYDIGYKSLMDTKKHT